MSTLEVHVIDRGDLATIRATLDGRLPGAGFQRVRDDTGNGTVTLTNDDPDLVQARYGDLLRFDIDGTTRFMSIVERKTRAQVDPAEEAGESVAVTGRGHLAVVQRNLVHPEPSPGIIPVTDTRPFGFASTYVDETPWTGTVETGDLDPSSQPLPDKWNDPTAKKIAVDHPVYDGFAPVGKGWLRKSFTIAEDATFRLEGTADDGFDARIDNVPILGEERPFLWQTTLGTNVFLAAGDHQAAVEYTNLARPGNEATNLAWVLLSLFELTDGGRTLGSVVWHTDDTWIGWAPASPPGFTHGQVLNILFDEWEARGGPAITRTFTDLLDSAGNAWAVSPDFSFRIGDDLLMVLGQLVEGGDFHVSMSPGAYELNAYIDDTTTTTVVFQSTGDLSDSNITQLVHEGSIA